MSVGTVFIGVFSIFIDGSLLKVLQLMCERLDLTHILDKIKLKFYRRLYRCDSDVLQYCLSISKYRKML